MDGLAQAVAGFMRWLWQFFATMLFCATVGMICTAISAVSVGRWPWQGAFLVILACLPLFWWVEAVRLRYLKWVRVRHDT